jgi:hypothetical protein
MKINIFILKKDKILKIMFNKKQDLEFLLSLNEKKIGVCRVQCLFHLFAEATKVFFFKFRFYTHI